MERAVQDLASLDDCALFAEIAEGIDLILRNVNRFDSAARHLSAGNHRGIASIIGGFAAEEAAKVLILLDAIRCPRKYEDKRKRTLLRFYNHFAKGLYVEVCDWRVTDFQYLINAINGQRDKYYLDGPNDVDWIMKNWITSERERKLYVDYVRYFEAGGQQPVSRWQEPFDALDLRYRPRTIVGLAIALGCLGMTTPAGLAVISDVWRPWRPEPVTTRYELREKIRESIVAAQKIGIGIESMGQEARTVIESWSFPLWDADLKEIPSEIDDLREIQKARWRARDPYW